MHRDTFLGVPLFNRDAERRTSRRYAECHPASVAAGGRSRKEISAAAVAGHIDVCEVGTRSRQRRFLWVENRAR
ncbi:unnamed protein product [Leptosia nina]|uniref:Uncharacterized protein n=1 Tax=Leptosia nina TaxID=320188 RepID=A0AAV1JRA8_9NEOP